MAERKRFRFELLMDAGNGAQKAGDILIKALAKKGVYVFIEPIIPAEISPPKRTPYSMSGVIIRLSSDDISNIGSDTDLMLVEHEILLNRRLDDLEFNSNCKILLDTGDERRAKDAYAAVRERSKQHGLDVTSFQMNDDVMALIKELQGNGKNMFYLGMLTALFSVPKEDVKSLIKSTFKKLSEEKLSKNLKIYEFGFEQGQSYKKDHVDVPSVSRNKEMILLDGNTAMSLGIIDSGIKMYSGYPITPASSIMHYLAKNFAAYGGILHQAEDEISAIGTVIGSYFAGVPAITATSGPGLSLKQEFLGLSVSSEIPCILINVQRGGPSTGLPTRTEQGDLFPAAFGSHGDSPKVVLSVSTVEDCFYAPHVSRYLAEKLRLPVIIMSDYQLSVSYRVLEQLPLAELDNINDISEDILGRFGLSFLPKNIEMVQTNQSTPGEKDQMRRVTGLNTNNEGFVEYTSDSNQRSHEIRNEKLHHVRRALKKPELIGDESGDILIVGWGSTRGVIEESIGLLKDQGYSVSGLHLKMVYPLPLDLKDVFSRFKNVVTVEVVYGDELKLTSFATMLRSETLVDVRCAVSDATGRPLKPTHIVEKVKAFA